MQSDMSEDAKLVTKDQFILSAESARRMKRRGDGPQFKIYDTSAGGSITPIGNWVM